MVEIAGFILGILGVIFAFESPRRHVAGLFSKRAALLSNESARPPVPVIDICHQGISVEEIEPNKLRFDIPYCAGKNANAHNVKLQSAILRSDGTMPEFISSFGDDFPEGITLTYETGKSISYTLSPLSSTALPFLYIVVRGTYTAEDYEKVFAVFNIFKFNASSNSWIRTLGAEDRRIRAFVRIAA